MRVEVDSEICARHGQCRIAAPAVFDFDAAGNLQYEADPAEDLWPDVEDAVDMCPVQAISIRADGPALSGGQA
ncbi:MAG: ferredoxin [Streptosporangiaceae bacterium]|jgi:ferredoxin